jgi:hypothetical protein
MRIMLLSLLLSVSGAAFANGHLPGEKGSHPHVGSLAWMTGGWSGPVGPEMVLEENWSTATAGTIASLVRMTSPEGTAMVEMVHIEEVDNSLELHIQQWDTGFKPRSPAQKMRLAEMGEQSVAFTAASPGALKKLGYALVGDEFQIRIRTADDQEMLIKLAPKS